MRAPPRRVRGRRLVVVRRPPGACAKKRNITGTRKSERIVDEVSPPTTASASGWFASEPCSRPIAVGMRPMTVARLVIAMGTKRERAAAMIASTLVDALDEPAVGVVDEQDAVRDGDADDHQDAHQRGDREALPGGHQREHDARRARPGS